jgi:hypothetical protein
MHRMFAPADKAVYGGLDWIVTAKKGPWTERDLEVTSKRFGVSREALLSAVRSHASTALPSPAQRTRASSATQPSAPRKPPPRTQSPEVRRIEARRIVAEARLLLAKSDMLEAKTQEAWARACRMKRQAERELSGSRVWTAS